MKPIIDVCCGSRMFWFDRKNPKVVFMDNRTVEQTLCDGRKLEIKPDVVGDFRHIPYQDNTFYLVVFDPPHLVRAGKKSWIAAKYGKLGPDWRADLKAGFDECLRVLKPYGTLVFKWNEEQVKLSEILHIFGVRPLFGHQRGKTHFLVFMKQESKNA
ncbi:SAM-dependent methyltransferase [Candidatus Avelusimicrobium fimicolum]|uniref:SAM-dependent methyltransferase n=1 Tax=Candidatus Avelusimicrobium fimicolum TaxID=3416216 RepID=UPI003D0ABCA6